MTFSRFTDSDESEPEDERGDDERVFPRIKPIEGGAVTFRRKSTGHIHYLPDEGALAYGVAKSHYFYKYNGYAISAEILEDLSEYAEELRDAGEVPEEAEVEYVFFFVQDDKEVLQFTVDQYLDAPHEYENNEGDTTDLQYIVPEAEAICRWPDGYSYILKDPDYNHGFIST